MAERADKHARAAQLLAAESAPPDEVAAHLLLAEPAGQPEVVAQLRDAATQATRRGAPQSAVAYLRRALEEGLQTGERCPVLHELARAEALVGDQAAVGRYEAAIAAAADPVLRARLEHELSHLYFLAGHWERGLALLQHALAELGDREPQLAARIEASRTGTEFYHPRYAGEFDERLPRLEAMINRPEATPRALALVMAGLLANRGNNKSRVLELVTYGIDGGRFLRDDGPESLALPHAVVALVACDELDAADRVVADVLPAARRRGSVVGFGAGSVYRVWIDASRGHIDQAAGHLRAVIDLSLEHNFQFALPTAFLAGVDVLLERSDFDDVRALAESIQLEPAFVESISGAWVIGTRGRLRGLRGEREAAIADLRSAGEIFTKLRLRNPIMGPWRSELALLLSREAAGEASALVASELADARDLGLPRCEGTALRAAGLVEGGHPGIELLGESLRVLNHANLSLERARTLVELGAALRRADQRVRAREQLREGLDLAQQCGAERLAARAVEELRVTGARPRRRMITGPDALTPSEARIVRMAADRMGNRDIALMQLLGLCHRREGVHAQRWLDEVTASMVRGEYVDPRAGRVTFKAYAEQWRTSQVHRVTSQLTIESALRRHTYPTLGDKPLSAIKPSDVQAWVKRLSERLAPRSVILAHGIAAGVFKAAMRDRLIASNPCDGTGLPKVPRQQIEPLPTETVWALVEAVPPRYRALVILAAGTGMRQGEALGLTVDRIDFLRRVVRVDQQLMSVPGRESFLAPPKTAASVRTIPLPQVAIDALAAHLAAYPPSAAGLVFTTGTGAPVRRSSFGDVWRAAVKAAGAPPGTGIHQLRHYYASLLIRHGESVKVVQARLGHASANQTLDTYSHLWPDSDDRTRTAVDSVLSADYVRTEGVVDGRTP